MFLVPSLILAVAVWFLLTAAMPAPASARPGRIDEAIEIVRGRLARGEIDAAEYNRLVAGLICPE
jgi:uncharacterized membrane protein